MNCKICCIWDMLHFLLKNTTNDESHSSCTLEEYYAHFSTDIPSISDILFISVIRPILLKWYRRQRITEPATTVHDIDNRMRSLVGKEALLKPCNLFVVSFLNSTYCAFKYTESYHDINYSVEARDIFFRFR